MMRELAKYSLTTFHGCGDNIRNTAACPWASVCPHRRFDVLPYARKTAEFINSCRDLDNLPRKFKVTYSGCEGNCGQPLINCVGVVAIVRKRPDGSRGDRLPRDDRRRHGLAAAGGRDAVRLRARETRSSRCAAPSPCCIATTATDSTAAWRG